MLFPPQQALPATALPPTPPPPPQAFLKTLDEVALASDAFFPFRDSIDVASTRGVSYLVAAGGSVADPEVIAAADEYNMSMAFSGLRLFHH